VKTFIGNADRTPSISHVHSIAALQHEESSMKDRKTRRPVSIALQGGGSYGAYAAGVLDTVLASRRVAVAQLSGTSAGALNAAIVASALASGGPPMARERLRSFWQAVAAPAVTDLGRGLWGPLEQSWRENVALWIGARAFSPYQANPLGLNPLRDAIAAHVDIAALPYAVPLYVTVTNVRTGLPRVFRNEDLSLDALVASASLPQLFQAIEIDGEPYWDGGYSGNPSLRAMLEHSADRDLLIVQLTPAGAAAAPTDTAGIQRRVNEIVFNASLVAEIRALAALRELARRGTDPTGLAMLRMHRVGPPAPALLADGSPFDRSPAWIARLQEHGRRAGRRFLARHHGDLGVRETLDVAGAFAASPGPVGRTPANEPAFARTGTA
jgi:NTE family protein